MKPLIPSDTTSQALGTATDRAREDQSLHDEILTRLRDYIVEGNIPDGGRVPERQLCEMLGISRTPLREALKVLASEGLVELLPNRGARVRQLSEHDLGELFDVMGGLEGLAGRLACENITDAEIAEIERLHYEMYGFYLHRDMHGYFRVNQLIHQKIVEASRNATLREHLCELRRPNSPDTLLRQFRPQARALGRSDARTRDHPGRAAPPRRQRTQRHPVQAPAQQADRRRRTPEDGRHGGVRAGLIPSADRSSSDFAFKIRKMKPDELHFLLGQLPSIGQVCRQRRWNDQQGLNDA